MSSGPTAFFQESVIYAYMKARFRERSLRVSLAVRGGVPVSKKRWIRVRQFDPVENTRFPDVTAICLSDDQPRPAEIKFRTSLFRYHLLQAKKTDYEEYKAHLGCIVVLSHDYIPQSLLHDYPGVEVYELDYADFADYAKENFTRLLDRQLHHHTAPKVWVMQQSKNFYQDSVCVSPARITNRWCPSDKLTQFELSTGDTVLFVRQSGCSYQKIAGCWSKKQEIHPGWFLQDVCVTRLISPIQSRHEYLMRHKLANDSYLFYDESPEAASDPRVRHRGECTWPFIFEFEKVVHFENLRLNIAYLYAKIPTLVHAIREAYTQHVSREIAMDNYVEFLQELACQRSNDS